MEMSRLYVMMVVAMLVLAACGGSPGLANPASVYCTEQGGTLEIRSDTEAGQVGYCLFADGSECEEWAYYRGECAPGQ